MTRQKRFMVVPRSGDVKEKGITTSRGHRSFKRRGCFFIKEPTEANEIDNSYGLKGTKEVDIMEDPMYEWHLHNDGSDGRNYSVHHYTFGHSRRFADAWEDFERRRKDGKKTSGLQESPISNRQEAESEQEARGSDPGVQNAQCKSAGEEKEPAIETG